MQTTYQKIYKSVKQIPLGKVATYGQIARLAGIGSPRVVGNALHVNPDPATIPCHRVVNAQGRVAADFAFGGGKSQQELLEKEGIVFTNGRIELSKYQWQNIL